MYPAGFETATTASEHPPGWACLVDYDLSIGMVMIEVHKRCVSKQKPFYWIFNLTCLNE
jgi:hypothetical protein